MARYYNIYKSYDDKICMMLVKFSGVSSGYGKSVMKVSEIKEKNL